MKSSLNSVQNFVVHIIGKSMSSRGVLVNNDSIESMDDFPTERPVTPRTPRTPRSPLPYSARDYFHLRGNVKIAKQ